MAMLNRGDQLDQENWTVWDIACDDVDAENARHEDLFVKDDCFDALIAKSDDKIERKVEDLVKPLCITFALIDQSSPNTKQMIDQFMTMFKETIVQEKKWQVGVTHCIVNTNDMSKFFTTPQNRTTYCASIHSGAWIIDFEWIKQCIKQKQIVKEEEYETIFDNNYKLSYEYIEIIIARFIKI